MRLRTILGIIVGALLAQAPEPASIEGVIVDKVSGEPIVGATVELTGINDRQTLFVPSPISPTNDDSADFMLRVQETEIGGNYRVFSQTATTDKDGKFTILNVRPGTGYQLVAYNVGQAKLPEDLQHLKLTYQRLASLIGEHFPTQYGQPGRNLPGIPIALAAGERRDDIRIEMTRTGSVSGRVLGPDGKPMSGIAVEATLYPPRNGAPVSRAQNTYGVLAEQAALGLPQWSSDRLSARTNAKGEYRIVGLAPGPYFVSVYPYPAKYMPTFFPNTLNADLATKIDISESSSVTNVDFTLIKAEKHRVQGIVVDRKTGQPVLQAEIRADLSNLNATYRSGGQFHLELLPGPHILEAFSIEQRGLGPNIPFYGSITIDVGDTDLKDVVIKVGP